MILTYFTIWAIWLLSLGIARPRLEVPATERSHSQINSPAASFKSRDIARDTIPTVFSIGGTSKEQKHKNANQETHPEISEKFQNITLEDFSALHRRVDDDRITLKPLPTISSMKDLGTLGRTAKQADFIQELGRVFRTFGTDEANGNHRNSNNLPIFPSQTQMEGWKINGIPIGVTGYWFKWAHADNSDDERAYIYRMWGLEGCTATLIVTSQGFWVGHHWESSKTIGGPSSFRDRLILGDEDGSVIDRTDAVFKEIAVDILDQPSPPFAKSFKSLSDVKLENPGVFDDKTDLQVFILTKAKSETDSRVQYASKIKLLVAGYRAALPGLKTANLNIKTYVGKYEKEDVDGTITMQYTPYQEYSDQEECSAYTLVKVWAEDIDRPVVTHTW